MSITVTFDPQTDMETNCDRLRFFGEKEHYDNDSELLFNFTGRFSSGWSRGKIDAPKMVDGVMTWECEADHFAYRFYSDGSSTSWGYKFTCTPNFAVREHTTATQLCIYSMPLCDYPTAAHADCCFISLSSLRLSYRPRLLPNLAARNRLPNSSTLIAM